MHFETGNSKDAKKEGIWTTKPTAPLPSQVESPSEEGDPRTPNLLPKHLPPPGARAQGQQGTLCREVTHIEVTCGSVTATLLI